MDQADEKPDDSTQHHGNAGEHGRGARQRLAFFLLFLLFLTNDFFRESPSSASSSRFDLRLRSPSSSRLRDLDLRLGSSSSSRERFRAGRSFSSLLRLRLSPT